MLSLTGREIYDGAPLNRIDAGYGYGQGNSTLLNGGGRGDAWDGLIDGFRAAHLEDVC